MKRFSAVVWVMASGCGLAAGLGGCGSDPENGQDGGGAGAATGGTGGSPAGGSAGTAGGSIGGMGGAAGAAGAGGESVEPTDAVAPGVYAVTDITAEDALRWERLEPLVANARVVALGETEHFSDGYHQVRKSLIPFLVETLGYRAVSFEGPWRSAEQTRNYLKSGDCDTGLAEAVSGLYFYAWTSQATADTLSWLCNWNTGHPNDPVEFWGVDVQDPFSDATFVQDRLSTMDPATNDVRRCFGAATETELWDRGLSIMEGKDSVSPADHAACLVGIDAARALIDELTSPLSTEDRGLLEVATTALTANESMWFPTWDYVRASNHRDQGMAEIFLSLWALRAPESRAVFWGANLHIMPGLESAVTDGDWQWKSTGSWLRDTLGDEYVPVGLYAQNVTILDPQTGKPQKSFWAPGPSSLEARLAQYSPSTLLVDVAEATGSQRTFGEGETFPTGDPLLAMVPRDHWPVLIWIRDSVPMTPFP